MNKQTETIIQTAIDYYYYVHVLKLWHPKQLGINLQVEFQQNTLLPTLKITLSYPNQVEPKVVFFATIGSSGKENQCYVCLEGIWIEKLQLFTSEYKQFYQQNLTKIDDKEYFESSYEANLRREQRLQNLQY